MSSNNDRLARAVHFGAGKIGRGFLGPMLFAGGCRTTFIDIDAVLVAALDARRSYPLRLISETSIQEIAVDEFETLHAQASAQIIEALLQADLVSTAVGASHLPQLALPLAQGINARAHAHGRPFNILFCENQWHAASLMRPHLEPYIWPEASAYFQNQVGLVETVVGRAVPNPTAANSAEDPLLIVAEPDGELLVAGPMLRGPLPPLPGLIAVEDIDAYEARKLFLHNLGHAALAYLGYPRRYEFIRECVADPAIADICHRAMHESARALAAEYGFSPDTLQVFQHDLMRRFANKALGDTVARVAADPLRKLRPQDRLIGPAQLCLQHGIAPVALAQVIAAALRYDHPADAAAQELQARRALEGDHVTLQRLCRITPGSALSERVLHALHSLG